MGVELSAEDTGNGLFRGTELEGGQLAMVSEICPVLEGDLALAVKKGKSVSAGHAVAVCLLS